MPIMGGKQLDRKLRRLGTRSSKKAMNRGISASMTPVARAMRSAINATDASPELKRKARKTIGRRFARTKGRITNAKVGFGVGKRKKPTDSTSGGVGISSSNIHWFVLGTEERFPLGGFTGRIEPVFQGLAGEAVLRSQTAAMAAARRKVTETLIKEARRR